MTSKKLGALLRSVPPATAIVDEPPEPEVQAPTDTPSPPPSAATVAARAAAAPSGSRSKAAGQGREAPAPEREVPLQVLIPASVRKQLALHCAEQGESLRSVMLQAIRSIGIEVSDTEIAGKRGRKNY